MKNPGYSVLLVEDNPDHISFQKNSIKKIEGISRVEIARNAREAQSAIRDDNFDLIILDYDLPDSDGLIFLETLTNSNHEIPVVMVTGLGNEKVAVKALKLGAYDYVVKDKDYLKNLPDIVSRSLEKLRLSQSLKKMERQLRESEERYQILFENANSGFVSVNLDTNKFIKPNKKFMEMTGFNREKIENMNYYDLATPVEKDKIVTYYRKLLSGDPGDNKSSRDFEYWIRTNGGEEKYVNCTVALFPQMGEMFMTFTDITDRKILEEKLKKAHSQLKRHTRQLESEVDELKKRLVIEPALEYPTDTEQKYDLDFSCSYLVKEKRPARSYEIFKDLVSHGVFGLVITRTFPERIQKFHRLKKTPMVWLSKLEDAESTIPGSNLGSLLSTISEFIDKSDNCVIILDGLEFLITVNGFDRCIQFMNDLFEVIMVNPAVLIIPVNPDALAKRELAILERSTEEISLNF